MVSSMGIARALALVLIVVATGFPVGTSAQVDLPVLPDPVPVELPVATTAFLVLDIQSTNCSPRPICIESLPAIVDLLDRARAANMLVVYTGNPANILPEIAPRGDEPFPATMGGDKFYNSDLDQILTDAGIDTVLLVGTTAVNAVVNTAFAAAARGYTVAVADDGISADNHFEMFYARYHLLLQNRDNVPLRPRTATLTRGDLITFVAE
jgi:nicotinamidase-related amidase